MDDLKKFRESWQRELYEKNLLQNSPSKQNLESREDVLILQRKSDKSFTKYSPCIIVDNLPEGKRTLDKADEELNEICNTNDDADNYHSVNTRKRKKLDIEEAEDSTGFLETLIADLDEINDIPFFDIEIPRELGIKIFQYLSMQDLCNCAQVSSSWRSLADDQLLWFPFYKTLGLSADVNIDSEANWKLAVRDGLMQRDLLMTNWKGRIGRVTALEHITGGVLCAVSSCDIAIIAGFSNGSVKLWKVNTQVEEETMLCSCYDNMGLKNSDRPSVNNVAVNTVISVATYNNGDVDIWSTQHGGDPIHHYHQDGIQCVSIAADDAQVASASGKELRIEAADNSGNWFMQDCITLDKYIDNVEIFQVPDKKRKGSYVSVSTASGLYIYMPAPGPRYLSLVHAFVGSTPTCMEVISDHIACGFGAAGFQESFTVKLFDIETKHVRHVFRGHNWDVTCLHSEDALKSILATGCKDKRVRLFDFRLRSKQPVMQLSGHGSAVTQVQVDEWKVLSGGMEGMVCLWDQRMQRKLWDAYARHPVRYIRFKGGGLVTANIPNVKTLEDELETVTHRRLRGELRHYNFLANQTREGLPSVCLSNYDEPEGYNYNIRLAAPYDDL